MPRKTPNFFSPPEELPPWAVGVSEAISRVGVLTSPALPATLASVNGKEQGVICASLDSTRHLRQPLPLPSVGELKNQNQGQKAKPRHKAKEECTWP